MLQVMCGCLGAYDCQSYEIGLLTSLWLHTHLTSIGLSSRLIEPQEGARCLSNVVASLSNLQGLTLSLPKDSYSAVIVIDAL